MKSRDAAILVLPGLGGSGPDHWQSRWELKLSTAQRVEQDDWDHPDCAAWSANIGEAIARAERPVVLIAHSLGSIAAAHVLTTHRTERVAGAYLVAPPAGVTLATIPAIDPAFGRLPTQPLPCPTVVVASTNDPYCSYETAEAMAATWGARLISAGEAGHINTESGHGPWPEGLMAFAGFLNKL